MLSAVAQGSAFGRRIDPLASKRAATEGRLKLAYDRPRPYFWVKRWRDVAGEARQGHATGAFYVFAHLALRAGAEGPTALIETF